MVRSNEREEGMIFGVEKGWKKKLHMATKEYEHREGLKICLVEQDEMIFSNLDVGVKSMTGSCLFVVALGGEWDGYWHPKYPDVVASLEKEKMPTKKIMQNDSSMIVLKDCKISMCVSSFEYFVGRVCQLNNLKNNKEIETLVFGGSYVGNKEDRKGNLVTGLGNAMALLEEMERLGMQAPLINRIGGNIYRRIVVDPKVRRIPQYEFGELGTSVGVKGNCRMGVNVVKPGSFKEIYKAIEKDF